MSKTKKCLSVFMAVVLTAVFVLSVFFVIFESEHISSSDTANLIPGCIKNLKQQNELL